MEEYTDVQWNIFKSSMVDNSTTSVEWVEYKEDNVTLSATQSVFKFNTKDLDAFLVPHEGALEIEFHLLNNAGNTVVGAGLNMALVNDCMHLFRSAEYKYNEKPVERIDYTGMVSLIKHLVLDSPEYIDNQGKSIYFYREGLQGTADADEFTTATADTTANGGADAQAVLETRNPEYNEGFMKRQSRSNTSTIHVFVPLRHIFGSHGMKRAMRGARHTYEFTRNSELNAIVHRAGGVDSSGFVIDNMSIWMPIVKPSIPVLQDIERSLASGAEATRIFQEWNGYRSNVFINDASPVWRITSQSKKPLLILITAQVASKIANQTENGATFDHLNATQVELRVNSRVVPQQAYTLNYATNKYTRAYYDFLSATGRALNTEGALVDWDDYKSLYPIYAFNLSSMDDLYKNIKTNDIEVRMQCNAGVNYYLEAVIVSEREIKLKGVSNRLAITV